MPQAADVLLANASTANVGCLDSSGFNNPTFNLSHEDVNAWEYQVGLVAASAAYCMRCSIICVTYCQQPSCCATSLRTCNYTLLDMGRVLLPCMSFCFSLGGLSAWCVRLSCAAGVHSASATQFMMEVSSLYVMCHIDIDIYSVDNFSDHENLQASYTI